MSLVFMTHLMISLAAGNAWVGAWSSPAQGQMVAAEHAGAWSISQYRVTTSTEPTRLITEVDLVGSDGRVLGRYRRIQQTELVPGAAAGEPRRVDHVDLDWQGRKLSVITDRSAGTFEVIHNGVPLGTATFRRDRQDVPAAVATLLQTDADLWRLMEAIERDLLKRP